MFPIKIITPFYNPGRFLEKCIASLMTQHYANYQIIFIDDCSTDGSFDKLPAGHPNVMAIRNATRKTALENIHDAIMNYCQAEDIVVLVDGDDTLTANNVLSYIDEFYKKTDCWAMYGQAIWSSGQIGFASRYTPEEFADLRNSPYKVSHIRTFMAGLYHQIKNQDREFACLKDREGNFYKMTYDVAITFPIFELAGFDRVQYNDKILYCYNFSNPISDHRVNQQLQTAIHREIANKPKFRQIRELGDRPRLI